MKHDLIDGIIELLCVVVIGTALGTVLASFVL